MIIYANKNLRERFKDFNEQYDLKDLNGLYTWYATSFEVNHHPLLLMVNQCTHFDLIFTDIHLNDSRESFQKLFAEEFLTVCETLNISSVKAKIYLEKLTKTKNFVIPLKCNDPFASILNEYKELITTHRELLATEKGIFSDPLNINAAIFSAGFVACRGYNNAIMALKDELIMQYPLQADIDHISSTQIKIKPSWKTYTTWKIMDGKISTDPQEMHDFYVEVKHNNYLFLNAFRKYLVQKEKNKRMHDLIISYVKEYLNDFLLTDLHQTIIHDIASIPGYIFEFMPSQNENPEKDPVIFIALSYLIDFLEISGQISKSNAALMHTELSGVKTVVLGD